MIYLEAFSKVLPVILLFTLGAFLRRTASWPRARSAISRS